MSDIDLSKTYRGLVLQALEALESDHVENNLFRLGILGADDVQRARHGLREVVRLLDKQIKAREDVEQQ